MRLTILLLLASFASVVLAQQPPASPAPAGSTPAAPPPVQSGEVLEPDVTIIAGEKETVHEYRLNGVLYMIKVEPKSGPPYFLIDADGDGDLESRRDELDPGILVPTWMILRW